MIAVEERGPLSSRLLLSADGARLADLHPHQGGLEVLEVVSVPESNWSDIGGWSIRNKTSRDDNVVYRIFPEEALELHHRQSLYYLSK